MKDYEHIRNQLGSFLHQDYDLDSEGVPQAIVNAVVQSDLPRLVDELTRLQSEPPDKIREVLNDHEVHIWDGITPQELLVTMRTLALLYLEEQRLEEINKR